MISAPRPFNGVTYYYGRLDGIRSAQATTVLLFKSLLGRIIQVSLELSYRCILRTI